MPYLVLIRGVLDGLGDSIVVSDSLEMGEVRLGEDVFVPVTPVAFDVTVSNVGEAIIAQGGASARFRTTCARCLCEFEMDVTAGVDGFFVEAAAAETLPDEQDRELVRDERIDLEPVVVDALVVELPFAPRHAEDCAGICPACGADLNAGECGCAPPAHESPFARLRDAYPAGEEHGPEGS